MVLELEVAALLSLEAYRLAREILERRRYRWLHRPATPEPVPAPAVPAKKPVPASLPAPPVSAEVQRLRAEGIHLIEILKRGHSGWTHVGYRQASHPDVADALSTKGLALRQADGSIHEGAQ
jgi:hypothetical protein